MLRIQRAKVAIFVGMLAVLASLSGWAKADKVHVAVASNFTKAAQDIAAAFKAETGHDAVLSFGSTGKLYIQIKNGAPFGVFLAADEARPVRLEEEGDTVADSRFTYATGKIVLYSRQADLVDGSATVLRQKDAFSKIAIANEKTAPYGVAAVEVMEKYGIYNKITHKIVRGDNIAQTYQFVFTENAQLGFVALSQVIHETEGSRWVVPQEDYHPIRQQAVLLNKGAGEPAALAFVAFLKGKTARDIISSYGYGFDD